MRKTFVKKFKDEYQFLEDYGFVFDIDPYNPNRMCYKNNHGEIVLWINSNRGSGWEKEIFIQINGWKTEINVKEEYKKNLHKSTMFKTCAVMFKELFLYLVKETNNFYGLNVGDQYKFSYDNINKESFLDNKKYNPVVNSPSGLFIYTFCTILFVFLFAQLGIIISFEYVKSYDTYQILRLLLCIFMFIINCITIILLRRNLWIFNILSLVIYPIILIGCIYFFNKRMDYIIYQATFLLSFLYLVFSLILKFIFKNKKALLNGVITIIFPFATVAIKSFELNNYIYNEELYDFGYLLIPFLVCIICTIIYLIFRKDKSDKKDYYGGLLTAFFSSLFLSFAFITLSVQNINYSFDKSEGIVYEYTVLDKELRRGTGRHSSNRYYIIIKIDGKETDLYVNRIIYEKYKVNDKIKLTYYKGYLNDDYYEYDEELLNKY